LKFGIVTPSYNQAAYIERTIESVLAQRGDFELDYLVVDGGSTDGTLAILQRYAGRVRFVSERDRGQSDALNKGFRRVGGDVLAWINSDDAYLPGALQAAATALRETGARWCFGDCRIVDESDREIRRFVARYKARLARGYSLARLLSSNFVAQPATFFERRLYEQAGPIDESLHYAMDYDLWLRFARFAAPAYVPRCLASFRVYRESKTGGGYRQGAREALEIARRNARRGERTAVALHWLHYQALVAVYRALGALTRSR
jgi:glycosyltransferase involved in cell wall biosynthesis